MSIESKRITRSMKQMEDDAAVRQVLVDKDEFHESNREFNVDDNACRHSIAGSLKHTSDKNDYLDVRSMCSQMHDKNLTAQLELEEEGERLALEAKLMRKRALFMERRSLLLKEASQELENSSGMHNLAISDDQKEDIEDRNRGNSMIDRAVDNTDKERLKSFLIDCERNSTNHKPFAREPVPSNRVQSDHRNQGSKVDLPKVELPKFSGNVGEYWSFIKQFETHVESRTTDPSQRLLHLFNYCCGEAKDAIIGCLILPSNEGYSEARALLKRLFGRCHIVSRKLIEEVLNFPRIHKYDDKALTQLYVKMLTCWRTLNQMGYLADINAVGTIQRVVDKLPSDMSDRWIRETYSAYESGREPEFMDLVKFIDREAAIAQTRYAERRKMEERSNLPRVEPRVAERWRQGPNRMIHFMNQEVKSKTPTDPCLQCDGDHKLVQCPKYNSLTVNERWELAKQKGCCYCCLSNGHTIKECRYRNLCGVGGCSKRHHRSLHVNDKPKLDQDKTVCNSLRDTKAEISLGVIPVRVVGPKGITVINALLDTGANTTLICKDVITRLGITGIPTRIKINTVLEESSITAEMCQFTIESTDKLDSVNIKGAFAVEDLPIKLKASTMGRVAKRWSHLDDIPVEDFHDEKVLMIIGCDQPKAHWILDTRIGGESQPFGIRTPLGWILLGPMDNKETRVVSHIDLRSEPVEETLDEMITQLYNNEFQDLCSNERGLSREEQLVVDLATAKTVMNDGKYEVPLPWRQFPPPLINNMGYAMKRLQGLKKRFSSTSDLVTRYDQIIQDHLEKGYIARLSHDEVVRAKEVWYIPHHPVFNPKKPEKLRIVFDCAAKYQGRSINDCLYPGPDTTANLVGILLRFRRLPIAIVGDIEEMFLQVRLPKKDQNLMRFLWWSEGKIEEQPDVYKMLVHPFGATSSPFCANYALKRSVTDNRQIVSDLAISIASQCMYVDDCIASVGDVATAKSVIQELREITSRGGFKMRKWLSNHRDVLKGLPNEDLAKNVKLFANSELPVERTLGVEWDAEQDELRFRFDDPGKATTRRGILSTIATTFDPLGLVSPFILTAKIILQTLCKEKSGWDQPLEGENLINWTNWKERMRKLHLIKFPRCIRRNNDCNSKLQLHLFADASEVGYGAVAYVRILDKSGRYVCRLLMAKSRVAPLKTVTIPRLELSAAVLATRMGKTICKEFEESFERVWFWVDSVIVLRYLHNTTSRFTTFVANRVQEILETSGASQWKHVRSELNPADYASRGMPTKEASLDVWMNGPEFLKSIEDEWPSNILLPIGNDGLETKRMIAHIERTTELATDRILNYYSSWHRMSRAVAWLVRFKQYLCTMTGKDCSLKLGKLSVREVEAAELYILRYVQKTSFPKEFVAVCEPAKELGKFNWDTSCLKKLCPRQRNGLLVMDSRIKLASVSEDCRYPIILPKEHAVTAAIVMYYHQNEGHSGTSQILATVRERFWIVHGGAAVKRILRKCIRCRVLNATSMSQKMAPLPKQRVTGGWYPFQYTGIDYFGPFQVRRGRLLEKRYGCLFTCLQCRAVHIELAQTLSTESFVLALIRFMNRRGTPKEILSDNGGNFVGAERELKKWVTCLDQNKIVDRLTERRIEWKFNPPSASHRGGVWERMIRSVRKILNSVAWRQSMDEETLWTYLTEAERVINDRPLTTIRDGPEEPMPLRPRDLLQPTSGERIAIDLPVNQLIEKRWRVVNNLIAEFWRRWKKEYLSALQERQRWTRLQRELEKGDVVMLEVESTPRTYWPLGIIVELLQDGDGMVRTVLVKTCNGVVKRDIRKVYRLEGES